ncbi:MAG: hypothetical protein KDJ70_11250 [Candidatus Competibacteraceae bacterium]|nr:hypothetical protein [Candidatus Competibacteraceae bacterium]
MVGDEVGRQKIRADQQHGDIGGVQGFFDFVPPHHAGQNLGVVPPFDGPGPLQRL